MIHSKRSALGALRRLRPQPSRVGNAAAAISRTGTSRHISAVAAQQGRVSAPRAAQSALRPLSRNYAVEASLVSNDVSRKPLFNKILIANRGEIACRVIRTAKKLGIKTVAVYSEVDHNAMHVKMADEAYCIGPAPSAQSYLRMDKIIEVAHQSGAQAIHPGYGFLSENARFAEKLAQEGIVFIGPPASAIVSMGSKSESKDIMTKAGVPCVPGYHGENQDPAYLGEQAAQIGFPVLIKAVLGGGGKGMKIVRSADEFPEALASAKREAMKSFSDERVLVERYIERPRHVEVQVFGDTQGEVVSLWERDCSVQRRHQKIIEEAPAPGISEELRADLGAKAVAAAKAVNYVGAGTVEFIFDNDTGDFFFMEMNTRLQVEHPVTEMITAQDLVEWQLEVAAGNPLPLTQAEIPRIGHAFEARIYAENPRNNFLPDVGPLVHIRTPAPNASLRLEEGFAEGSNIEVFYDPLIAKLVAHGRDRTEALRVLSKALAEYEVVGVSTNIEFLKTLAENENFIAADVDTGFINKHFDELFPVITDPPAEVLAQAALYVALRDQPMYDPTLPASPWATLAFRRFGGDAYERTLTFQAESAADGTPSVPCEVKVKYNSPGVFDIAIKSPTTGLSAFSSVSASLRDPTTLSCTLASRKLQTSIVPTTSATSERLHVFHDGVKTTLLVPPPAWLLAASAEAQAVNKGIRAPMPSVVVEVKVAIGDVVEKGQAVVVLESMKTETVLRADRAGKVVGVGCANGEMVEEGRELVILEDAE